MGFIGDILSPGKGAGFQAGKADVVSPVNEQMAQKAIGYTDQGLQAQNELYKQLAAQGGIQNQSNVFNQQQALANQLGVQAQGGGPNPALAQLNQATGANVSNQAALMAGQRGAGANAGLMARQASMQGGAAQQQMAGQAAVLRAQQQLAAQQALQGQQGMMGNLATNQVGQQAGVLNQYNQGLQNQQNMLLNSINAQNNANVGMQSNMNNINGSMAQQNAGFQQGLVGGGLMAAGAGAGLGGTPSGKGGTPPMPMASGGEVGGPMSNFGKYMSGGFGAGQAVGSMFGQALGGLGNAAYNAFNPLVGGKVGQAGASDLNTQAPFERAAHGGHIHDYTSGGKLPGKAEVKGDSLKNDKVPILGSPGEIMLPRSVTQHPDAPKKAAEFVAAIMAKNNMGKRK